MNRTPASPSITVNHHFNALPGVVEHLNKWEHRGWFSRVPWPLTCEIKAALALPDGQFSWLDSGILIGAPCVAAHHNLCFKNQLAATAPTHPNSCWLGNGILTSPVSLQVLQLCTGGPSLILEWSETFSLAIKKQPSLASYVQKKHRLRLSS